MLRSKLLNRILLCVAVAINGRGLAQKTPAPKFPNGGVVMSPVSRLPTDSDRVIRDFVQLLYPQWDDAAWDLVITGKRSMNPNFGVDSWSFAVLEREQPIVHELTPSAVPCTDPEACFKYPKVDGASLVGRLYQKGTRVEGYTGARPEIAKKNADFQKTVDALSIAEVETALTAAGAHYGPSRMQALRRSLAASHLFRHYDLRIASLQFCRSTGVADKKEVAMFWSSRVFSSRFHQNYLLTIEPFEGDITGLLTVDGKDGAQLTCGQ